MIPSRNYRIVLLALSIAAAACSDNSPTQVIIPPHDSTKTTDSIPPVVSREMRGLWVATVANIDWPSKIGLTADQQKAELIDILDRAVAAGINTVIFQVRPAANALYNSSLEPWGQMFTGVQGANPGYDPLQFAIDESHARGLELHAWINPFRAGNSSDTLGNKLAPSHVWYTKRNLVRVYGSQLWLDPGDPASQDHTMAVIKDIVTRYDIDGIHADDYFYPYVENNASGQPIAFPDDSTFAKYGNGMARDDWRRSNIDNFVQRMYTEVHAIKPLIKVGIAPFGIWRPGNPPGVTGLDAYASIYADSRKWLQNGWVDYFAPQLYWSIASTGQSYPALLDWWLAQNTMGRNVWPGLAAYRVLDGTSSAFSSQEIPNQIALTRAHNGTGNILYNTTWTLKKNNLAGTLAGDLYKQPALVPASPWLDATPPAAPAVTVSNGTLQIMPGSGEAARWWTVRTHNATGGWTVRIIFGTQTTLSIGSNVDRAIVQAVDKAGNVSTDAEWRKPLA